MEARYFSGFKRGPYKQLISILRNATRNRAVIAISFIGKSILEIVTPKNEADRLIRGLDAIGYRHLSKFDPTKNAISTSKVMSAEERKRKNLELALSRFERSGKNCHSHWATKWYKRQKKRIRDLTLFVSFEQAMVIDTNAVDEPRVPMPNANRVHPAPTLEVSNSFAVLSPEDNDGEPLPTIMGSNHMEVEEPPQNISADQENMDVEIHQNTARQIPEHEPTTKDHTPSNTIPHTANVNQDSDADSLGSDWDHELRRHKQSKEKGAKAALTQKELATKAKKINKAPFPLRRSRSCCNFVSTPITKSKPSSTPSASRRQKAART